MEFQARVLDQLIHWGDQGVNWNTVRGDALTWGLDGSLLVNDRAEAMGGLAHYDNPYTNTPRGAAQMDIVHDGQGLRLIFDETTRGA